MVNGQLTNTQTGKPALPHRENVYVSNQYYPRNPRVNLTE